VLIIVFILRYEFYNIFTKWSNFFEFSSSSGYEDFFFYIADNKQKIVYSFYLIESGSIPDGFYGRKLISFCKP
jgi:hypothetical protein